MINEKNGIRKKNDCGYRWFTCGSGLPQVNPSFYLPAANSLRTASFRKPPMYGMISADAEIIPLVFFCQSRRFRMVSGAA